MFVPDLKAKADWFLERFSYCEKKPLTSTSKDYRMEVSKMAAILATFFEHLQTQTTLGFFQFTPAFILMVLGHSKHSAPFIGPKHNLLFFQLLYNWICIDLLLRVDKTTKNEKNKTVKLKNLLM